MAQSNWEADKMLDVYIYDYLVKKKWHVTAKSLMTEGKIAPDPVAIDAPGGFLYEWWSVFWDIFIARTNEKHSEAAAAYIEAQQIKAKDLQQLQMQQLLMRQAQMQRRESNNSPLGGSLNGINSEGMLGQSTASALAAKIYKERMRHPNQMDSEASQPLFDARMALMKSTTNHSGQLVQGNSGSMTAALQQIQELKGEVNLGSDITHRSLPADSSSIYGAGIMQSKPGIGNGGLNSGVGGLPLKGWPLTLSPQQQHQLLAQAQAQGNLTTTTYGDMEAQRFRALQRNNLNGKDGQSIGNDGTVGSPMQSTSSKINIPQVSQSSSHQQDQLHTQQGQQINRKRKGPGSSGAANSTGTGNTIGHLPSSQPSTPSTHTPGDGVPIAANLQNVGSMSKNLMIYVADAAGGLASSKNQLDDMEHLGDIGSLDDHVESFLSQDDNDARDLFGTLKKNPSEHATENSNGFSFNEVGCMRKSNSKVGCCHFSSDGKLLASAGHDKKVVLWNMETRETESTSEEHTLLITDVRFRPNSTQLATSSFDTTVRLWDAAQPNCCLQIYSGHNSQVTSLDFHPIKSELFCSCDANNEIRLWNINQNSSTLVFKGGSTKVRFQPRTGSLLAAASENLVSIFDVESDRVTYSLKGHSTVVHSVCWDKNGDYLASISQESVRIWSIATGECIHEQSSSGNIYHSGVFHPNYPSLLVLGSYQSLEFWNMAENNCMTIPAHEGVVSCLAESAVSGMIASASHDKSVKIWK